MWTRCGVAQVRDDLLDRHALRVAAQPPPGRTPARGTRDTACRARNANAASHTAAGIPCHGLLTSPAGPPALQTGARQLPFEAGGWGHTCHCTLTRTSEAHPCSPLTQAKGNARVAQRG